jgi:hypothetical protein
MDVSHYQHATYHVRVQEGIGLAVAHLEHGSISRSPGYVKCPISFHVASIVQNEDGWRSTVRGEGICGPIMYRMGCAVVVSIDPRCQKGVAEGSLEGSCKKKMIETHCWACKLQRVHSTMQRDGRSRRLEEVVRCHCSILQEMVSTTGGSVDTSKRAHTLPTFVPRIDAVWVEREYELYV